MSSIPASTATKHTTRVALFAAVMASSAFIRIPLGPVPLTMQTFVAITAGYVLGARDGAYSTLLYTGVGLAGIPIFASGGGPGYVMSPTFGYIIGFTAAAAVTGFLARFNRRSSSATAYLLMLPGLAALYVCGLAWLTVSLNWIAETPLSMTIIIRTGLLIPAADDLVTLVPAAIISVRLRKILRRQENLVHDLG